MPSSPQPPKKSLSAMYKGPESSKTFAQMLPDLEPESTESKTRYLAALHAAIPQIQVEINAYLTKKMEEEKASANDQADRKEEENYGEEVVGE
ncbi:MAG: hypothetical protein M1814_001176 [Vezdaea aestivalis]|nr:MAG: hypothetical protein M1814_001176 [Vezdaea aestivalis]